ncbi:MAG: 4Fe-4S dicluster domain-containing protein [Solirubrobacterales bacterium]|nr:4Fe-4S dicluster domain-containing protein [Solirubrobacterales bacterium]
MAAETRAWDEIRPPELDLIEDCVHCGFCLPTCPTYSLWHEEMDSPRGRIVLMREGLEPGSDVSASMVGHLDNCLGCMACVTACPSGVAYDKLITDTRAQVERNFQRPRLEAAHRRIIFGLFTHPGRLRALIPGMLATKPLRLERLLGRFPKLQGMLRMAPPVKLRDIARRIPEHTAAEGSSRGRVAILQGCVQRVFFADVNQATIEVLSAEGWDVDAPRAPRCCGSLMQHTGADEGARALARETIEAFADYDAVIVNAAGCGSGMKEYPHLLRDDPEWSGRAETFAAKVKDVSELLAGEEPRAPRGRIERKVAYHDACHLAHAQGIRSEPREMLRQIPGVEIAEPEGWEICCGSAGIYNLVKPEPAAELGRRKAEALAATGAESIAAANPGCSIQIAAYLGELGRPTPIVHPIELVYESIQKARETAR